MLTHSYMLAWTWTCTRMLCARMPRRKLCYLLQHFFQTSVSDLTINELIETCSYCDHQFLQCATLEACLRLFHSISDGIQSRVWLGQYKALCFNIEVDVLKCTSQPTKWRAFSLFLFIYLFIKDMTGHTSSTKFILCLSVHTILSQTFLLFGHQ